MAKIPQGAVYQSAQKIPEGATYDAPAAQPQVAATQKPEAPGFLRKAWDWANTGLVSGRDMMGAIVPGGDYMYDHLKNVAQAPPGLNESPTHAALRVGFSGAAGDTADTASGFTSPVSIGLAGVGAAGQGAGAVAKLARPAARLAGLGLAAKGAHDIATDDGSGTQADRVQRTLNNSAMVAGGSAGAIPGESVGNLFQKKSYDTMNNVLGVYGRDLKYDINPGRGVVQEGIAGANKKSILSKIDSRIPELKQDLVTQANDPSISGRPVNLFDSVNQPFQAALAGGDVAPSNYLNRLLQTQKELTEQRTINVKGKAEFTGKPFDLANMNVPDALSYKESVGRRTNFATDAAGQNVNPVLKEVYGRVNRDIRGVAPEIAPTLNRLADLQQAGTSLDATIGRRLASPASGLKEAVPTVLGGAMYGGPGATAAFVGEKALSSVPFKTYGAKLAYSFGKNLKSSKAIFPYGQLAAAAAGRR